MGRLVRSRLKHIQRDSYFLIVSCTSLLLYAICMYTFLHLNGFLGGKSLSSLTIQTPTVLKEANTDRKNSHVSVSHMKAQFDDGKIHEFQRNVGQPVDWEMRVKGSMHYIHYYGELLLRIFKIFSMVSQSYTRDNC